MPFEKGKSGNPGGRVQDKPWREAIQLALKDKDPKQLRKIAAKVVAAATKGEAWAIQEIGNRLDGKPAQQQIITGDDEGGPVRLEKIERVIVDPKHPDSSGVPAASRPRSV